MSCTNDFDKFVCERKHRKAYVRQCRTALIRALSPS